MLIQQARDQTGGRRREERKRERAQTEEKNSRQLPQRDVAKIAGKDYKPLHQREPLGTQRDLSLLLQPPSLHPWPSWHNGRPLLSSSPHPPLLIGARRLRRKPRCTPTEHIRPTGNPANDIMGAHCQHSVRAANHPSIHPPTQPDQRILRPQPLPYTCSVHILIYNMYMYMCLLPQVILCPCTCHSLFHWQPKGSSGCSSCTYHAPQTRTTCVAKTNHQAGIHSSGVHRHLYSWHQPYRYYSTYCKPACPSTVQALAPRAELLDALRLCKIFPCPPLPACLCLPSMVAPLKPLKFGT